MEEPWIQRADSKSCWIFDRSEGAALQPLLVQRANCTCDSFPLCPKLSCYSVILSCLIEPHSTPESEQDGDRGSREHLTSPRA